MENQNQNNDYDQDRWPELDSDEEHDLWLEECIARWQADRISEMEEREINILLGQVA